MDDASTCWTLWDVASQRRARVYVGNELRHHQRMQPLGQRFNELQLNLLDREPGSEELRPSVHQLVNPQPRASEVTPDPSGGSGVGSICGLALQVAASLLHEDASNPRTEFPDSEIDELSADIRERGILQPIVVHPADESGQYRIHFGAKRLRAALRAGLDVVPVVVRNAAADPYAAVAENQKRHNLSPLDLARFIKGRVVAGESNAVIARKLGMDLTTVAHHMALLDLPPPVDQALKTGLCTSPRTLYELSKLHDEKPEQVRALIAGGEITRSSVAALKAPRSLAAPTPSPRVTELTKATFCCALLEGSLDKINRARGDFSEADLTVFRQRLSELANRLG
ncbi:ParB/RepB/Spo0J family partition protein [Scleromatobacter humisilvae]|uniref:ParB/RepB/Spo0J family partition protein n=1 Tax=Scleromatobacter humisilvae TaxID=2897159 RepID=A0A9X2C227_9BURK|nr:ParB/RepB/Spo0J family partition protein [Scleromatobacter humisilvae]MCK9689478.1 ParB/RepB/Spo0J family partition protein [Scleromatobacter humisilvae]